MQCSCVSFRALIFRVVSLIGRPNKQQPIRAFVDVITITKRFRFALRSECSKCNKDKKVTECVPDVPTIFWLLM